MKTVNELSTAFILVEPLDENGDAFTPASARYRVDDQQTETNIVPWTAITSLSTAMEIQIAANLNTIINDGLTEEVKVVTVETDEGTASAHVEEYEYAVRNLQFVS